MLELASSSPRHRKSLDHPRNLLSYRFLLHLHHCPFLGRSHVRASCPTALSYVLMALLAKIFFTENVIPEHWLGIGLITAGVGFAATGPSLTVEASSVEFSDGPPGMTLEHRNRLERHCHPIVITATAGDILQARAMKEIGDLHRFGGPTACLRSYAASFRADVSCWDCCLWHSRFSACW